MGMGKGGQGPWRRPLSAHISGSKGDWSVEKNNSKNIVYSVEKAFRVLHAFTSEAPELLLSDVARRADVDNATAFRMLTTLVQQIGQASVGQKCVHTVRSRWCRYH